MIHTFIFEEGMWRGSGFLINGNNEQFSFKGELSTTHGDGEWLHETYMKLSLNNKIIDITNRCIIIPLVKGSDHTTWRSESPDMGKLIGEFVIAGDSILSSCVSVDSALQGAEYFLKINDTTYTNRGMISKRRQKVSSWVMEWSKSI
jgi:hypothetical protein